MSLIFDSIFTLDDFVQNILSHNTLISINILSGEEYFVTSNHRSHAIFGKINIDNTMTHNQINAYLIELIAGLILSSFHQDKISKTPPHNIYNIEKIPANKTISAIQNKRKSPISILEVNKALVDWDPLIHIANTVSININEQLTYNYYVI